MAMTNKGKRRQLLTDAQYEALYGVPVFSPEEQDHYFNLNDLEQEAFDSFRVPGIQVYFVLLLGYTRHSNVIRDIEWEVCKADIVYILQRHFKGKKVRRIALTANRKKRLYDRVLDLLGLSPFTDKVESKLQKEAIQIAARQADQLAIFDELVDYLQHLNAVIPPLYKFQKLISHAAEVEANRLTSLLQRHLSPTLNTKLQQLLAATEPQSLASLKKLPRDFSKSEIGHEIKLFEWVRDIAADTRSVMEKLNLSQGNVAYYASMVEYYSITQLRAKSFEAVALYLVCYLQSRLFQIQDTLVAAFIFQVRKLAAEAKAASRDKVFEALASIEEKVKQAGPVLRLFVDEKIAGDTPFQKVRKRAYQLLDEQDIPVVSDYLVDLTIDQHRFEWECIDEHKAKITGLLRRLFWCLRFTQDEPDSTLLKQIEKTQADLRDHGQVVGFSKHLIAPRLRVHLYRDEHHTQLNPLRAEWLLYRKIKDQLEKRALFVEGSQAYESITMDLVSDEHWLDKDQLIRESRWSALQIPVELLVQQKLDALNDKLALVSDRLNTGANESVVLKTKNGQTRWVIKYTHKKEEVNNPFFARMAQTHIADLLNYVNHQTGFFQQFRHIRPRGQVEDSDFAALVACIIANATRFGHYKMAEICNIKLDKLNSIQANLLRMETLGDANDVISNAIAQLPIFQHYAIQPDKIHGSFDGQKFESRRNTIRTRFSTKYIKTGPGLSGVTLNVHHVPVNAGVIGLNEHESHYVFDMLHNNTSDLQPDVLSTDTHGVNRFNFALLDLAGWTFAPRYARFDNVVDDLFETKEVGGQWQLKLRTPIKHDLIIREWDFIQRVMISLHRREASQSSIVRKLSGSPQSHRQFKALAEYNRLIKCLYVLDYLDDDRLRHYVQRALNRGEAYHQLQRHIEQVNGAKFRGESDRQIDEWYECARLVANAMIYFNSVILSKLLQAFERDGRTDYADLCKKVSPVAWVNINLNGTYLFNLGGDGPLDMDALIADAIERL